MYNSFRKHLSAGICLFFILLAGTFGIAVVSAHPGNTDVFGCHFCREGDCPAWGVETDTRHCHIKPSSPHTPTGSNPQCPEDSSYSPITRKCECFHGFYADRDHCVPDRPVYQICREKHGFGFDSSEETKTCSCRQGYKMTETGKPGCEKIPINELAEEEEKPIAYRQFGVNRFVQLNSDWRIQSQILTHELRNIAKVAWELTKFRQQRTVQNYQITLWRGEQQLATKAIKARTPRIYLLFKKDKEYLMEIVGLDKEGEVVNQVLFRFET